MNHSTNYKRLVHSTCHTFKRLKANRMEPVALHDYYAASARIYTTLTQPHRTKSDE